jgi:hypothetical protein
MYPLSAMNTLAATKLNQTFPVINEAIKADADSQKSAAANNTAVAIRMRLERRDSRDFILVGQLESWRARCLISPKKNSAGLSGTDPFLYPNDSFWP